MGGTYLYKDNITDMYMIHDVEAGFDYKMSEFDIRRNIEIEESLTGIAEFYNARLDDQDNIVLD